MIIIIVLLPRQMAEVKWELVRRSFAVFLSLSLWLAHCLLARSLAQQNRPDSSVLCGASATSTTQTTRCVCALQLTLPSRAALDL